MQTTINKDMAIGVPGTHGNGQPYFADPYIAASDVVMGGVAAVNANGKAVPYSATATTPVGIFVNPNEHVRMVLPSDTRSLTVAAGNTVAIANKGAWYVKVPTADATSHGLLVGTTSPVAEILETDGVTALIRFL